MIRKSLVILGLFAAASVLTVWMTPKSTHSTSLNVSLADTIPSSFADWKHLDLPKLSVINPDDADYLNSLYSQLFDRVYINSENTMIMLSIAYGAEQRRNMLAHFPELCYPAQGFNIDDAQTMRIPLLAGSVDVKQIKTRRGNRFEDVTYWARVGKKLVSSRSDQKWESVKYGLNGVIPDGLIFRVSSIGVDDGFALHETFINDLFASIDPVTQQFLASDYYREGVSR